MGVSIIILAGDVIDNLQRCVELMVGKTSHENFEIIVVRHTENGAAVNDWLNTISKQSSDKVKVVTSNSVNNPAALYNAGVAEAKGDFIVLLNTRAIVVQNNWLTNLLNHLQRPEVGSAGCKIISLDQKILSAGEIIGGKDFCSPVGYGATINHAGYMQRLQSDQNYTLLNIACLMIKKEAWHAVNGLDESLSTLKQINIDLSFKLRQAGYMSVWTPYSVVASDELQLYPCSKASHENEEKGNKAIQTRWLPLLLRDPAYNDNFASHRQLFNLELHSVLIDNAVADRSVPTVLGLSLSAGSAAAHYHAAAIDMLHLQGAIGGLVTENALDFRLINRANADACVISSEMPVEERHRVISMKKRQESVFSLIASAHWIAMQSLTQPDLIGIDRLIVQNEAQAEAVRHIDLPVAIAPRRLLSVNAPPKASRREGDKLRVLCNTCELGDVDIELVHNLVRELANEVRWQVIGPLPHAWEPWIDEHYRYPGHRYFLPMLMSIDTDLAIIPRADNKVNRLKDNFSLLELAACTIPVLVSDVSSLQSHIPVVKRVRNRKADWLETIRQLVRERAHLASFAQSLTVLLRENDGLTRETVDQQLQAWLPR